MNPLRQPGASQPPQDGVQQNAAEKAETATPPENNASQSVANTSSHPATTPAKPTAMETTFLEWDMEKLADPVEKLRLLRQSAAIRDAALAKVGKHGGSVGPVNGSADPSSAGPSQFSPSTPNPLGAASGSPGAGSTGATAGLTGLVAAPALLVEGQTARDREANVFVSGLPVETAERLRQMAPGMAVRPALPLSLLADPRQVDSVADPAAAIGAAPGNMDAALPPLGVLRVDAAPIPAAANAAASNAATTVAGLGPLMTAVGEGQPANPTPHPANLPAAALGTNHLAKPKSKKWLYWAAAAVILAIASPIPIISDGTGAVRRPAPPPPNSGQLDRIWMVEKVDTHEMYSNGLRIETKFTALPGGARAFTRFRRDGLARVDENKPFGIVFHTTESMVAAFEEEKNRELLRAANGVVRFVRMNRAYHYVVDRFGRVWRVVPEDEPANHAGNSSWSDEENLYVQLNHSFLSISFEGRTRDEYGQSSATPAQMHAGRLLTEMLRNKYGISPRNCVTHAQVSMNPSNFGIGWHTDWADNFPFKEMGLEDNYQLAPAAIADFGFESTPAFDKLAGPKLLQGLALAESELRNLSVKEQRSVGSLREVLRKKYHQISAQFARPDFSEGPN